MADILVPFEIDMGEPMDETFTRSLPDGAVFLDADKMPLGNCHATFLGDPNLKQVERRFAMIFTGQGVCARNGAELVHLKSFRCPMNYTRKKIHLFEVIDSDYDDEVAIYPLPIHRREQ